MIVPIDPRHIEFVEALAEGTRRAGGTLQLYSPKEFEGTDIKPYEHIAAVVDELWKFYNIGVYVGGQAKENEKVHEAMHHMGGRARVETYGGLHYGYWPLLLGKDAP